MRGWGGGARTAAETALVEATEGGTWGCTAIEAHIVPLKCAQGLPARGQVPQPNCCVVRATEDIDAWRRESGMPSDCKHQSAQQARTQ